MTFNSATFLFVFLPVALLGFHLLGRLGRRAAIWWLAFMSLVFYAQWKPAFVLLLIGSIFTNFLFARLISGTAKRPRAQFRILAAGIAGNLAILCYCKYLFPFLGFLHAHGALSRDWGEVVLPLGISFFTFTQIAYLVDLKQGQAEPQSPLNYTLFVTFFPHLISGPILHHKEIMPQFAEERRYGLNAPDFALGATWFVMGLFKKVMIADRIAPGANALFNSPAGAGAWATWSGVLFYVMQLYFDFSGYSDMALGLARMFSIRFPVNFNSPYKAASIIDYWQRWHMTLTRFLTLYIYNPIALAVRRRRAAQGKANSRKALATPGAFVSLLVFPTVVTMFLAGVWHGAGAQFLIFGLLHGCYLSVNHLWRTFVPDSSRWRQLMPGPCCVVLVFLSVAVADVFFRASSLQDCFTVLAGMAGARGAGAAWSQSDFVTLSGLFAWVWLLPNTQEVLSVKGPGDVQGWTLLPGLRWKPSVAWAAIITVAFVLSVVYAEQGAMFLYFQF